MTLTITTEEQKELEQARKDIIKIMSDFCISPMEYSKQSFIIWKIANRKK